MSGYSTGRWGFKAFLLVLSLGISLGIGEAAVRLMASRPVHSDRQLFSSSRQFRVAEGGAVLYLPDDTIRMIAVYDGNVDFDVTFETNNVGLIDTQPYPLKLAAPARTSYGVVGNSFVAGMHGGHPWVPQLRALAATEDGGPAIYNLGVEGTGFWHFSKLVNYVSQRLNIDVIVVVAISDDLRRPYWLPLVVDSAIHMCPPYVDDQECARQPAYARLVNRTLTQDSVVALAMERSELGSLLSNPRLFISHLAKRSHLLVLTVRQLRAALGNRHTFSAGDIHQLQEAYRGRAAYLLQTPQKHEVSNGRYDVDLSDWADTLGLRYISLLERCNWTAQMYHVRDSHPNQLGYDNLRRCVSIVLGIAQQELPGHNVPNSGALK